MYKDGYEHHWTEENVCSRCGKKESLGAYVKPCPLCNNNLLNWRLVIFASLCILGILWVPALYMALGLIIITDVFWVKYFYDKNRRVSMYHAIFSFLVFLVLLSVLIIF